MEKTKLQWHPAFSAALRITLQDDYWLQNLRTDLKAGTEIRNLVARYEQHRNMKDYEAVMDLITRANWKEMEVERNDMSSTEI